MATRESHWGIVVDNRDPARRGRLIVQCDTIAEGDVLEWIEPSFHFVDSAPGENAGSFWVPNTSAIVEVTINADPGSESLELDPRWECCVYSEGAVPDEFLENYPNRRGWVTRAGHVLYFDDTEGQRTFYYQHPTGAKIQINNAGEVLIETTDKVKVVSPDVRLGTADATEHAVLGDAYMADLNTYLVGDIAFFTMLGNSGLPAIGPAALTRKGVAESLQGQLSADLATRVKVS